jgi:tetratricopeptide (TPR) repeat protein
MRNSRLILLGLLLLVSCNTALRQNAMQKRLANLDSLLNQMPRVVLDSLEQMDISDYPEFDQAYYNLLLTIARDKAYVEFRDDSIISLAADWYRKGSDPEKLVRSLIYLGIVRYGLNPMDTLPYLQLKEAEGIMNIHALEDPPLQVLLYGYLGDIALRNLNYDLADDYFEKELSACQKTENHRNYIGTLINLFYSKILLKKTDEVQEIVLQLNTLDSIPDDLTLYINKVNAYYYQTGHSFNEFIARTLNDSLKGMHDTDKPRILFDISQFYMKLNRIDSAVVYGEACIQSIIDSLNIDNYSFYKHLAFLYSLTGEYKESSDNYKKALEAFQTYHTVVNEKRILELEKKYNIAEVQQQLLKEKLKKRAFIIGFVVLFAIALILSFGILYWKHTAVRNKRLEIIQQQKIDQLRFFVAAINCTLGILPDFVANVNRLAHKNRETCPELYHTLQEKIVSINKEYRKSCSAIIQDPLFNNIFNDDNSLPAQLSDREKLIHKLSESGFSNELIAGLLNVTTDNIRSSKSKINRKIAGK